MRKLSFLFAAAFAFGIAPFAMRLGPIGGPLAAVGLAVLLACAASGGPSALAVAAGAAGAFGAGVLGGTTSAVAGACLVGFAFAERTLRVRTPLARAAHLGVAVVGGSLAGVLSSAYASAPPAVEIVSILVASVLVALPLLIDADDPIAHALEGSASLLRDPVARCLREGAALRRHAEDALVDGDTRKGVTRTWRALLNLAEARVRLERMVAARPIAFRVDPAGPAKPPSATEAVVGMLDQKIADHVAALTRAYTAVDTARAAELGLDDTAARGVDAAGETLEDVSRAIMEVKA